jgi:hypothetical protein
MRPGEGRRLTAAQQYLNLRTAAANPVGGVLGRDGLTWRCTVSPTPLSRTYRLRIEYHRGLTPKVFVEDPDLSELAEGRRLPHVYEQRPAQLCLYLPGSGEWHHGLLISRTIIPWATLWLFYFEEWLASGEWKGGGMHPAPRSDRQKRKRPGASRPARPS